MGLSNSFFRSLLSPCRGNGLQLAAVFAMEFQRRIVTLLRLLSKSACVSWA